MSKREEFIDKTDRRKIPKLSYSIEYICDRIVDNRYICSLGRYHFKR